MLLPKETERKRSEKATGRSCYFCRLGRLPDYKNYKELQNFLDTDGRIQSARCTHLCAKHQHYMRRAVENARKIALLPIPGKKKTVD